MMKMKNVDFIFDISKFPATRSMLWAAIPILLAGCLENNSSFEFMDSKSSSASQKDCKITNSSPKEEDIKVSAVAGNTTDFLVGLSSSACKVSYQLNGATLDRSEAEIAIDSAQLNSGQNILIATSGSTTKKWVLTKNQLPTCGPQLPVNSASGLQLGLGSDATFTGSASDPDGDAITFSWNVGGTQVSSSVLSWVSSNSNSQGTFTPDSNWSGERVVNMRVFDGIDYKNCSWNVTVNPACSVTSTSPPADTTVRAPALSSAQTLFQAAASTGCTLSWKLNGVPINGTNNSALQLLTSALATSSNTNTLEVTASNASSTQTKTWTVLKNTPPLCASQVPGMVGASVGVGGTLSLTANTADSNSDPVTFSWTNNGTEVGIGGNSGGFSVVSNASSSSASFTPTASASGTNVIRANMNDGYDTANCSWTVQVAPACQFISESPSSTNLKISSSPSASMNFLAATNDSSCAVTWSIDGSPIAGATSQALTLLSSQVSSIAPSTLTATANNGFTTTSRSWTITKNQPPTCNSQTPSMNGNNVGIGGSIIFSGTANNPDNDNLTFTWIHNGQTASAAYFTPSSSGNTAQVIFTPIISLVGNNQNVTMAISDGYDTANCSWYVSVQNACTISGLSPLNTSDVKMSSSPTGTFNQKTFQASANPGCNYTWALNGATISGATTSAYILNNSSLNAGSNILQVSVSNGFTSDTKLWSVVKNTPPSCSSQNPASAGNSVGVGGNITFQVNASNTDNDSMTFDWKYNGSLPNASHFTTTSFGNSSQMVFNANASYTGIGQNVSVILNDGFDTASCAWTVDVLNQCIISQTIPSNSGDVRAPFNSSATTLFQAPANAGCAYTWTLNNQTIATATSGSYYLPSSSLNGGSNTLSVSVTNGFTTDTKNWTVVKNTPPICSSQSPTPTGSVLAVGSNIQLTGYASDANFDTITFNWTNQGAAIGPEFVLSTPGSNGSRATFSPTSSFLGFNNVLAMISDGYDSTSCSWSVEVVPACSITTANPSTATARVASNGAVSNTFIATPSDASCLVSWKLNDNTVVGATSSILNLNSSQFLASPGTNTLVATASNGLSTTTRSWTVTRNQAPTCDSQTPNSVGSSTGIGGNTTFVANVGNPDTDTLTYSWLYNGSAVSSPLFTVSSSGNTGQAIFAPTAAQIGAGQSIQVNITDGYDSASCSWTTQVVNSCSISTAVPATSTYKVSAEPSIQTAFAAIPTDATCAVSWTLNGTSVGTGPLRNFLSSQLSSGPGTNTIVATLNNGVTSPTTRTWVVAKNQPPTCQSKTPASNPGTLPYNQTRAFSAVASDPDGDTVANFGWRFQGLPAPTLFSGVSTTAPSSAATFVPTLSQVGNGQLVSLGFDDGYDAGSCSWTFDIVNPNTVDVTACLPAVNPVVVYSSGADSTKTLQVVASNALGDGYKWYRNGVLIGGITGSSYNVSSGSLAAGDYTFKGVASDALNNTDDCDFNVKVNAAPQVTSVNPSNSQAYNLYYKSSITLGVTATDGNNDSLSYEWKLNGFPASPSSMLPSGSSITTFNPNGNASILGSNTISVTVSDGYESVTRTWTIRVNAFSQACNNLLNSNTSGGKICTLVGNPSIGDSVVPSLSTQAQIKINPSFVINDDQGNLIFSDTINHVVWFWNRSSSAINRWGFSSANNPPNALPAGQLKVIVGNGADGLTQDNTTTNTNVKLNSPRGIAYDSAAGFLYIADWNNHRIVRLGTDGKVVTVLGQIPGAAGITNNAAGNTSGNLGTTHWCQNPADVRIVNNAGNRWLYVSCYSSHTIKRLDVLPTSANYLKAYNVVATLNSSGASVASNNDGTVPSAQHTTELNAAGVNAPTALSDDGNGNIYWIELGGYRLRMATTAGASMTFFGGTTSIANWGNSLYVNDRAVTGGMLQSNTQSPALTPIAATGANANLLLVGSTVAGNNTCTPFIVMRRNASNNAFANATPLVVNLGGAGAGAFFSDNTCSTTAATVTIPANRSSVVFYYRNATAGGVNFSATATGLTGSNLGVTVGTGAPPNTADRFAVFAASNHISGECAPFLVQYRNSSNLVAFRTAAVNVNFNHQGFGNFYTDATCSTTPVWGVTIAANTTDALYYYRATAIAPANATVTLAGTAYSGNQYNQNSTFGALGWGQAWGLQVETSAGNVTGFYYASNNYHRVFYLNNTGSPRTISGAVVPAYGSERIFGTGGTLMPPNDGLGSVAQLWSPMGVLLDSNTGHLFVADTNDRVIRGLPVSSTNGETYPLLGSYKWRNDVYAANSDAVDTFLADPTGITIDTTNNMLYVSDSSHYYIRSVNLLTGKVNAAVGMGTQGNFHVNGPTSVNVNFPRGLAMVNGSGNVPLLVFADQGNWSSGSFCQIRAANLTPTQTSLAGQTIPGSFVVDLAGDSSVPCGSMPGTAPGVNLGSATTTGIRINTPDQVAFDGTNILFSNYNDHCIMRVTPAGNLINTVGTCGSAGTSDGNTSNALIRFPTAVMADPLYPGNFFFADAIDQNPSRIRYVNYYTACSGGCGANQANIYIGGFNVPPASGGNASVTTILTVNAAATSVLGATAGWVQGLATFGNQVCYAAGHPNVNNGTNGPHFVQCFDRSAANTNPTITVGPASNSNVRAGAPLGSEMENVNASYNSNPASYSPVSMNSPFGLAFDGSGNLYISERSNHLIRMVRRWF